MALLSSRILSFLKLAKMTPSSLCIPAYASKATGSINSSVIPLSYIACTYAFTCNAVLGSASTITRYPCSTLSQRLSLSILKNRPEIEAMRMLSLQIRSSCSTKRIPEVGDTSRPSVIICKRTFFPLASTIRAKSIICSICECTPPSLTSPMI